MGCGTLTLRLLLNDFYMGHTVDMEILFWRLQTELYMDLFDIFLCMIFSKRLLRTVCVTICFQNNFKICLLRITWLPVDTLSKLHLAYISVCLKLLSIWRIMSLKPRVKKMQTSQTVTVIGGNWSRESQQWTSSVYTKCAVILARCYFQKRKIIDRYITAVGCFLVLSCNCKTSSVFNAIFY